MCVESQLFVYQLMLLKCFMGTEIEVLTIGSFVLFKEQQHEAIKKNYEESYELD